MLTAFSILMVLIASVPALAIADGPLLQQVIAILVLAGLTASAIAARVTDVAQLGEITRPLTFAFVLPALWMVFQAIPMPVEALSHSVWKSAAEALQQKLAGHISIDPGKTVDVLWHYVSGIALVVTTILVTRDRRRAEQTLFALGIITTLTAMVLGIVQFADLSAIGASTPDFNDTITTIGTLGFILDLTAAVRVIERYESRHNEMGAFFKGPILNLVLCLAGAIGCAFAFAAAATVNLTIAAALGVVAFVLVQIIRRFSLSPWSIVAVCATGIAAAAILDVWRDDGKQAASFALQFAARPSGEAFATTQRMIEDSGWFGSGAGTFAALLPIYQEAGVTIAKAPTTAATLAIEWGRPALFVMLAIIIWLVVVLFRGALSRGRDSFFSAAAAACVIVLLGHAFCDASLSQSAILLVGEVVIGLGLAQSIGRSGTG